MRTGKPRGTNFWKIAVILACIAGIITVPDRAVSAALALTVAAVMATEMRQRKTAWMYSVAMVCCGIDRAMGILALTFAAQALILWAIYIDTRSGKGGGGGGLEEEAPEKKPLESAAPKPQENAG